MGLACGKTTLPAEGALPPAPETAGDDDWKALLTASKQAPGAGSTSTPKEREVMASFSELPDKDSSEPYGLLDEYVDDLLGIPLDERPNSSQRATWQATAPQMVLEDGSRGPATLPKPDGSSASTPYLAGVLNEWATVETWKEV